MYKTVAESERSDELAIKINDTEITVPLNFEDPNNLPPAHPANWFYPRYADGTPHEPGVSSLLQDELNAGDTFVDCGAHVGYFSALAATQVSPSGQIVSLEPATERQEYIKQIVQANGPDVPHDALCSAVGSTKGELELDYRDKWKNLEHAGMDRGEIVTVPSRTLDDICRAYGGLDVVKIDIEGGEKAALEGAEKVLESARVIVCEVHPNKISESEIEKCLSLLSTERDAYVVEEPMGELISLSDYEHSGTGSYAIVSYLPDSSLTS